MYTLCNCTLKFSIGYFYLRVAVQRWHVWSIYILMGGTVLFSMIYFFLVLFQCIPGKSPVCCLLFDHSVVTKVANVLKCLSFGSTTQLQRSVYPTVQPLELHTRFQR
jgi:hypothetical protein